jgi:hypothetical protein
MNAVAIKKGQIREAASAFEEMGLMRCDHCGDEFSILHHSSRKDAESADRQALWLEKALAEEHECDKKHPDRIELPD